MLHLLFVFRLPSGANGQDQSRFELTPNDPSSSLDTNCSSDIGSRLERVKPLSSLSFFNHASIMAETSGRMVVMNFILPLPLIARANYVWSVASHVRLAQGIVSRKRAEVLISYPIYLPSLRLPIHPRAECNFVVHRKDERRRAEKRICRLNKQTQRKQHTLQSAHIPHRKIIRAH